MQTHQADEGLADHEVSIPQIVEYQCGSRDMPQSTAGEGDHQGLGQKPPARHAAHLLRVFPVAGFVVFPGERAERASHERPEEEVEDRTGGEERNVQIGALLVHDFGEVRIGGDAHGIGPRIQVRHSEEDRDEEEGQEVDRASPRLQQPAKQDAPMTARLVLNHQHGQAPDGDPEPEHEGGQIALNELRRIGEPGEGEGGGDQSHQSGDSSEGDHRSRNQGHRGHGPGSHLLLVSGRRKVGRHQ